MCRRRNKFISRKNSFPQGLNITPFIRQAFYHTCLTNGVFFMTKGVPSKRYTPEFKKPVAEAMLAI